LLISRNRFDPKAQNIGAIVPPLLKKHMIVNYVDGEGQQNKGYRSIEEAGLSVQGSDANTVWRAIYELVKAIGMSASRPFS
jgi:hypothetical protein